MASLPHPRLGLRRGMLFSIGLLLCACGLPLAHTGEEKAPLFSIHTAEGKDIAGPLGTIADDWSLRLSSANPILLSGKDWLSLRQPAELLPALPRSAQVVISGGDRLPIQVEAGVQVREGHLVCQPDAALRGTQSNQLTIPLSYVAILWLHAPADAASVTAALRQLLAEPRTSDIVLLRNGDQIQGTLTALDTQSTCEIEGPQQKLKVPAERVAAVAFNTTLLARPRLHEPYAHAVLTGGTRLTLLSAAIDPASQQLTGKTSFRQTVQFPLRHLLALDLRQGRAVYLSDLTPERHVHTPFLGVHWPWVRDGCVTGGELVLTDGVHDKGIGLHSVSRLSYTLDGKYRWFEAVVDLDQHTGRQGDARIAVLVDDQPQTIERDGHLTAGQPPLKLRIPVQEAKRLTLVVDYGARGDVQDHVNWADARLIH